jgi:putative peptidoglycan lipid II flippase
MSILKETDNSSITKPASKVMLGGILSLAGGLAGNVVIAAIFGAGADMDAFLTALVIPAYLQIVFYSSLSFVFVPAFIDAETNRGDDDAWALAGTFFWIAAVALFSIAILGAVFSSQIIDLVAPGFQGEKSALASRMLSILVFTIPLSGLSTLTVGIQNARYRFFGPSVAPAIGALGNVIILLIFSRFIGPLALCWGYVISMVIQAGITVIPVLSHGWKRTFPLTDQRVTGLGRLMVPLIFLGLVLSFSPVAERYFSSSLPDGQIAYMGYAQKISSMFVLSLASGISTTIFPVMARTFASEGIAGLSEKSYFGLQLTFAVGLPAIMISGAVAVPLTSIFLERGAFSFIDTLGVSQILFAYLLGNVLFRMIDNIAQRSFYVMNNTTTQPIVDSIFLILFIAAARFVVDRWGYIGIAWAGVVRGGLGNLTLWTLLLRKFPQNNLRNMLLNIAKYFVAALVAYGCARLALFLFAFLPVFFELAIAGLLSVLIYGVILRYFDEDMLSSVLDMLGARYLIGVFEKGKKWLIAIKLREFKERES